jgi:hypothetical protein
MRRARHIGIAATLCAATLTPALTREARATDPGAWVLAAGAGYAQARADGRWAPGWQLSAEGLRGLTEAWALRGSLAGSWHPVDASGTAPGGRVRTLAAAVGLVYAVDVLRVVPFAEAGLAVAHASQAVRDPGTFVGLQLGGGASYLIDRRWALAGLLRAHAFGLRPGGGPGPSSSPLVLSLLLRLERTL